jgi:hypothetical protein
VHCNGWQSKNGIKVGRDRNCGFANPPEVFSKSDWENSLRVEDNNLMRELGYPHPQRSMTDRIPSSVRQETLQIKFLKVPAIAMGTFKIRTQ